MRIVEMFGPSEGEYISPDAYIIDFDGDGISELVCNCTYADGGQSVRVYRNNGGVIEVGTISAEYIDSLDLGLIWINYIEYFDPDVGFVMSNVTEEGTRTATFTGLGPFDFVPFVPTEE